MVIVGTIYVRMVKLCPTPVLNNTHSHEALDEGIMAIFMSVGFS